MYPSCKQLLPIQIERQLVLRTGGVVSWTRIQSSGGGKYNSASPWSKEILGLTLTTSASSFPARAACWKSSVMLLHHHLCFGKPMCSWPGLDLRGMVVGTILQGEAILSWSFAQIPGGRGRGDGWLRCSYRRESFSVASESIQLSL